MGVLQQSTTAASGPSSHQGGGCPDSLRAAMSESSPPDGGRSSPVGRTASGAPPLPHTQGGQRVEALPAVKLTPQGLEYARQRGIYRGDDLSW